MKRNPLAVHAGIAVAVVAVAFGACGLAAEPEARRTAAVGVGLCAATGIVSFALKHRARTVNAALLAVVVVFGVRAVVAMGATVWAVRSGGGVMPFVYGFFGTYFPLQWVEISFLLAEAKSRGRGN